MFGEALITGSWTTENQLQMWDLRQEKPTALPIKWDNDPGVSPVKVYSAQVCQANGQFILAGGSGTNEARLYESFAGIKSTPTLMATMKGLGRACYSVDFSNQGDMCAISGGDGVIRVMDIVKPDTI